MKPIGSSAGEWGKKSRYTSLEARDETTHPSWTPAPAIYSARTCSQLLHTRPCNRYHRGYRQGAHAVSGGSRVPEHPHPKRGVGGAHSPRNRCTALTASASSTTSEKISKSCVHSRARAATVLAPRDLATLREGTRAGAQGRAGELRLLPTAPGLPATPQGPGLRIARVWSSARHRRGVRNLCARK